MYKDESLEISKIQKSEHLKSTRKRKKILKVKNSILELEKGFRESKDREKEELLFEPIIVSIDDTL